MFSWDEITWLAPFAYGLLIQYYNTCRMELWPMTLEGLLKKQWVKLFCSRRTKLQLCMFHLGRFGSLTSLLPSFVFLLIFFVKKLFMCLVLLFPYTRCMIYILFQCNYTLLQVNYSEEALRENIGAFMNALLLAKPAGLKKSEYTYDASIFEPSLVLFQ